RRLLLPPGDVGGEDLGALAHEHLGRGPGHAGPGSGDDRDLAVELTHWGPLLADAERLLSIGGRAGRQLRVRCFDQASSTTAGPKSSLLCDSAPAELQSATD